MFFARAIRYTIYTAIVMLAAFQARALDAHTHLRQLGYQSWQTDSGLPQNTVHAVIQTRDGYLWAGTEAGLVRFDSVRFATYTKQTTPQLPSDVIYSLMEDRQGVLWIGTSGGLVKYQNGTFQTAISQQAIWSIYESRQGSLWVLGAAGLARFDGQKFEPVQMQEALSETSSIAEDAHGALWIGTAEGLVHGNSASGKFEAVGVKSEVQSLALGANGEVWAATRSGVEVCGASGCHTIPLTASVHVLAPEAPGRMWIGTDKGLFLYESGKLQDYGTHGVPSGRVSLLFRDHANALWVSTSRGFARIRGNEVETLPPGNELSGNIALAAYEDREGNLWLGLESGGLAVLRDRKFTTYTSRDGLSDNHALSIVQGSTGDAWIGTSGGGLNRYRDGKFSSFTTANALSSNIVLAAAESKNGDLWIGTPDGLDQIHDGKVVRVFTSADGLIDDLVRSLYFDSRGGLWIGTRRGLSVYRDGKFTSYSKPDGLGSDLIGAMLEDRDGSLWIGTLGGLTHFQNGHFQNFTHRDGLSSNVITALHQDASGSLWIGTNDGGLNLWQSGKFTHVAVAGLPDSIYSILEDGSGHLWLSSNHGIYRARLDDLSRVIPASVIDTYGIADGMQISECSSGGHPAAWKMADGTLWFATLKGVSIVDPEHMAVNRVPPFVAIEQISVDDVPEVSTASLKIKPGHARFEFQYAGLSFVAPQKVRFRYMLEGFDRRWIDAGGQHTAYYTNLSHGRYTFRVMASNNDGVWSDAAASASLVIEPHFYQTLWFEILLAMAAVLLFYGGYRWRVRRVESEFQVVLQERSRIAREIHDTLAQGFVAVSVQLEVVGRILQTSTVSAQEHLERARALVRSGLEDARTSIWELRSQTAAKEDLATRMKKVVDHLTGTTGIKTHIHVSGTYRPLAPESESELVRIAQEAVVNAVRHGKPQTINVYLRFDTRLLEMVIEDDGKGFSGLPPEGHFGLVGMRERSERIGGKFAIESSEGKGTQVRVVLPVNK